VLGKQPNTKVVLGEVTAVNKEQRYIVAGFCGPTGSENPVRLSHSGDRRAAQFISGATNLNGSHPA
jgi:hypothetical protein